MRGDFSDMFDREWSYGSDTEASTKGLKSGGNLTVSGGSITVNSVDDCIHANGSITVTGGTFRLSTGDDGFHADDTLTVSDGDITVSQSYEGLEGHLIYIGGGTISVTASDDGLNAGGGSSAMFGRMPGQTNTDDSSLPVLKISGGTLYVNADGEVITRTLERYLKNVKGENRLANIVRQTIADVDGPRDGSVDFYNQYAKKQMRAHYTKIDGEYNTLFAIAGQTEDLDRTKEHISETLKVKTELMGMTESLRSIYNLVTFYDLKNRIHRTLILDKAYEGTLTINMDLRTAAYMYVDRLIKPQYREEFLKFHDFSTLKQRIGSDRYVSYEYEDDVFGWMRAFLIPSEVDEEGNIISVLFAAQSIGKEKSIMERLIYLSEIDSLTQIRNRYSGMREMSAALERSEPGIFGILDSDKFKHVNDTYGHIVGDEVLKCIAEGLKKMNPEGINMRLGGDEFAFYIEGDYTDAQIHERLQVLFSHLNQFVYKQGDPNHISVSVGVVAIGADHKIDIDEAYHRGDALLYQSKKTFGNALTIERIR